MRGRTFGVAFEVKGTVQIQSARAEVGRNPYADKCPARQPVLCGNFRQPVRFACAGPAQNESARSDLAAESDPLATS